MKKIPIALQLYSVREDCEKLLPATIEAVAKMGYEAVEFAGYYGRGAEELRTLLDANGLVCCGTHTGLNTLLGDELKATMEFHRILGNKYLVCPGLPEERRCCHQAWLDTAKLFNEIADRARPEGFQVGYHNHAVEFQPMDGEAPWDTLFSNTADDVVMQLDTGNCMHGGGDPIHYLRKYPGRCYQIHLKEFSSKGPAVIGDGEMNWQETFGLCETTAATEWYIVEQEQYPYPPLESADKSLQNLKKMLAER